MARIISLNEDHEGLLTWSYCPLEEIGLYMATYCTTETQRASELAAIQQFVSARQKAGCLVKNSYPDASLGFIMSVNQG